MADNSILVTAPYTETEVIDFYVDFDIIATKGSPEPLFDIAIVGVRYIGRRSIDGVILNPNPLFDNNSSIQRWENYEPFNDIEYDTWIRQYIDKIYDVIREMCKKSVDTA